MIITITGNSNERYNVVVEIKADNNYEKPIKGAEIYKEVLKVFNED
jgi:hypothetical protein